MLIALPCRRLLLLLMMLLYFHDDACLLLLLRFSLMLPPATPCFHMLRHALLRFRYADADMLYIFMLSLICCHAIRLCRHTMFSAAAATLAMAI